MSKQRKRGRDGVTPDFTIGVSDIIPCKQESYHRVPDGHFEIKLESLAVKNFIEETRNSIKGDDRFARLNFPSVSGIFIYIHQYIKSKHDYDSHDIDNMAKTVLDALCGYIYSDDKQVKTLLVTKELKSEKQHDFAYIAIKIVSQTQDSPILHAAGVDRAFNEFSRAAQKAIQE